MKTILSLTSEINDIQKECADQKEIADSYLNKMHKRVRMLLECIIYLESNPRKEFIEQMLDDSQKKLKLIRSACPKWDEKLDIKKLTREYEKTEGVKKINEQIKLLRFLLRD